MPKNGESMALLENQSKLGMSLIGIGAISLFADSQGWFDFPEVVPFLSITVSFLGMLTLMLSVGVDSEIEELTETFTMMEEEE